MRMSSTPPHKSAPEKTHARLDYLLSQIKDPALRNELERETSKIRMNKKFGLVFEEHLPEHVRLYHLPIKAGVKVVKRDGRGDDVFIVQSVKGKNAMITHEIDGHFEEIDQTELVVIKKFEEPVYPSLIPVDSVTRDKTKPYHTIINAENFHALELLLYSYEGMVDVIYIDPPYNTGARDWKYNNNYVDSNDSYRHSKWLSMMKRRLLIATRFLKSDGVLIVAIDENEQNTVSLLLRELCIERDLEKVIVVHHPQGNNGINLWTTHEYALFTVPKARKSLFGYKHEMKEEFWSLRRSGTGAGNWRSGRPKMFFAIHIDEKKRKIIGVGEELGREEKYQTGHTKEGYKMLYPIDEKGGERIWRYGRETMIEKIQRGEIVIKGRDCTSLAVAAPPRSHTPIFSVWDAPQYNAGTAGANLLTNIMGNRNTFPFPKSLYTVQDCIGAACRDRPHALILDFFAGSGTTLHATALLNAEDDGNRRCILVTNNEVGEKKANELAEQGIQPGMEEYEKHGICESVTWKRCKYAVNGKRDDGTILEGEYLNGRKMSDGFAENIQYFKLDYLDPNDIEYRHKLADILPILWLSAGCKGAYHALKKAEDWFMPEESAFAVLIEESKFTAFKDSLSKRKDVTHVFLVTDSEEAFRDMCKRLPSSIETKMLYRSYLENFRINIPHDL